jgi:hypothetical protein
MQSATIAKQSPANPLYRNMPKLGDDTMPDSYNTQGIHTIAAYIEWCQGRSAN